MNPVLSAAPPLYARRSMACSAFDTFIYFFGGVGFRGTESILDVSNDLWRFDVRSHSWECLNTQNSVRLPGPRRCVGFQPTSAGLYLWGGSGVKKNTASGELTYSFLNDLWLYRTDSRVWEQLEISDDHTLSPFVFSERPRPEPRYLPVFHVNGEKTALFSGYTEDRLGKRKMNDFWIRNNNTGDWLRMKGDIPAGYDPSFNWPGMRYGSMNASDSNRIVVCGGYSDDGDHNDLWVWEWVSQNWECFSADGVSEAPAPRYSAAASLHEESFWIFGGRSRRFPKLNFNDTWRFDLQKRRWECISPSNDEHRYDITAGKIGYHAKSSSAIIDGRWYVWGGEGLHGHVSDFWYFNFSSLEWQMLQPARVDDPVFW